MAEELEFYEQSNGSPSKIDYYVKAEKVNYSPSSGMVVSNAQDAIDELNTKISSMSVTAATAPLMKNNPYPYGKEVLKILAIGNSFTLYPMDYLISMFSSSGCDASKVCLYTLTSPATALSYWSNLYESGNSTGGAAKRIGTAAVASGGSVNGSLATVLTNDWDIVVFQQVSTGAADFSTYNPYLKKLVQAVRRHCTNKRVAIAWQMVWSRTASPATTTAAIVSATQQMCAYNGIDIIIPSGMAMENARQCATLNTNSDSLLADGYHPARGVGKYVVSAAWWEALLAPHFNVSILGNSFVHTPDGNTVNIAGLSEDDADNSIAVTNDNKELCQLAAVYAVSDMYEVTEL